MPAVLRRISLVLRKIELHSIRLIGTTLTVVILTMLLALLTIGSLGVSTDDFPFKNGMIILGSASVCIGIGGLIVGVTSIHIRWLGFAIFMYGLTASGNAFVVSLDRSDGFVDWVVISRGIWGWLLVAFFGARLLAITSRPNVMDALSTIDPLAVQHPDSIRDQLRSPRTTDTQRKG